MTRCRHFDCPKCGKPAELVLAHDAHACRECDLWIEKACVDPWCDHCAKRPERPSQVA